MNDTTETQNSTDKIDSDANVDLELVVRHVYSTNEDFYYDSVEEAADEYHGTEKTFEVFRGVCKKVKVEDLAPDAGWITEFMEEKYYEMFSGPPEYSAITGQSMIDFELKFKELIGEYWNEPTYNRVVNVTSRRMKWAGDILILAERSAA